MSTSVIIKGLDKLARINSAVAPAFKRGLKSGAGHIEEVIKVYPPTTVANMPKTFGRLYRTSTHRSWNDWYERGWGKKWALKGGGWHGIKSSKKLNRSWSVKIYNQGFTASVRTGASYAPYVHSAEKQTRALKRIGWKTDEEVLREELPTVERFLIQEVEKGLRTP